MKIMSTAFHNDMIKVIALLGHFNYLINFQTYALKDINLDIVAYQFQKRKRVKLILIKNEMLRIVHNSTRAVFDRPSG